MCHELIELQLAGAVSRVDRDATAFNHRDVECSFVSICEVPVAPPRRAAFDGRLNYGKRCSPLTLFRIEELKEFRY
jgi:hypothetical protein